MPIKIDIIIPTKNHSEDLFKCISSLNDNIDSKEYKVNIIIVDDHSHRSCRNDIITNTVKYDMYKNVSISTMFLGKDNGFIKSVNAALKSSLNRRSPAKYIGILHDDVILSEGWAQDLIDALETNDGFCVTPITINDYDSQSLNNVKDLIGHSNELENLNPSDSNTFKIFKDIFGANDAIKFNIGLYACLFKFNELKKLDHFDERSLTSIGIEKNISKQIEKINGKMLLSPKTYAYHICRSMTKENENLEMTLRLKEATEFCNTVVTDHNKETPNVLYTFVGKNEWIPNITHYDPLYEYVCFTTNEDLFYNRHKYYRWRIYNAEVIMKMLNSYPTGKDVELFFKLHPHCLFPNNVLSIWIDSFIVNDIKTDNYFDLTSMRIGNDFMLCPESSRFDCSYKMLIKMNMNGDISDNEFNNILQAYYWYHFPHNKGMMDTNIMIRKHNDERCILIMQKVWGYVKKYYKNDKLFMNFMMWVHKFNYSYIPNLLMYDHFFNLKDINK